MRDTFSSAIIADIANDPKAVFLTGDLGFNALESVQLAFGERFINAGIAEQNMVGVAAGLASSGQKPWVYSIATFMVFRPFEQIRNDICLHDLPVVLVGNGGGFGYGVMGPTHHALEDYGSLGTLPNLRILVPAFDEDVPAMVTIAHLSKKPVYLRLGFDRGPDVPSRPLEYAPWRCLIDGAPGGPMVAVAGPIAGLVWGWCLSEPQKGISLWVAGELPVPNVPPPEKFQQAAQAASGLLTVEEHVRPGGFGEGLISYLALAGALPDRPRIMAVPKDRITEYGDQLYCLSLCGLDQETFRSELSAISGDIT
jgi:transketolase